MFSKRIIYVIGVSGSGKTSVGKELAKRIGYQFFDGDDFHPEANVAKMSNGIPLNDEDRLSWLHAIREKSLEISAKYAGVIFACSALKEKYRTILNEGIDSSAIEWVVLSGNYQLILNRMTKREDHFMSPSMLKSQLDIWESPQYGLQVNIDDSIETILNYVETSIKHMKSEFGLIGLGVMGKSLCRNLAQKGVKLSLYNRHVADKEENVARDFINAYEELSKAQGFDKIDEFVASLASPKCIMIMVNSGGPVDAVIEELLPLLSSGDIIIDGGNSHYEETERRAAALQSQGIYYIGTGVSGGEEGALKGPSIMPGGSYEAYPKVSKYLETIAAKDSEGRPCCAYVGQGGAGHFVKMVHNGVEYAEMQLLAEVYSLLRFGNGLEPFDVAEIMRTWAMTDLNSYLLEITIDILKKKENSHYIIDTILDQAGNKGTGSWTTIAAAELGVPITMISSALFARYISAFKSERVQAATAYKIEKAEGRKLDSSKLMNAYRLARIINHHQGVHLMDAASENYNWKLNFPEIARIWTNGCIIRSELMKQLIDILRSTKRILLHEDIISDARRLKADLSQVVAYAHQSGMAIPCLSAASDFINGYIEDHSNANIIQAQRDYFGAHTYKKVDDPSGQSYHTIWQKEAQ